MRIAILCVALVVSSFSSADEARPWVISTGDVAAIAPVDATVIDRAMVKVSTRDLLDAETLELVLLDKTTKVAHRSEVERRGSNAGRWSGRIVGEEFGIVSLTVQGDDVVGSIWIGQDVFRISPSGTGGHILEHLNTGAFPECAGAEPGDVPPVDLDSPPQKQGGTVVIDVLAVYTPEARIDRGGTAGMQLWAQAAVDQTNLAFSNSEMDARFRLVHAAEVDYSSLPTGIADARDNARAGDDEDSNVAAKRGSITILWDSFETGDLSRWGIQLP